MPVLKWMQSSGLGGPRIGGLRILILVLPINHWDIAKSLAAVDKKKKSLELLGYTALYIFIHKQELPVLLEFFFLSYRLWLISWIWILWMSRLHRSCVYTNRYIVLLLQRFCSTLPWQALGLVLMLKISADTSKHVRFYSLFRVVSDFSPLCLTKQAWRVAWKTPRVPRVNVSGTQHSRVLPIPPYSRCSEPSIHPRSIHASQKHQLLFS